MANNPAAQQGWVKSKDPKTGRVFYANHITRKTQWDAPADWHEEEEPAAAAPDEEEALFGNNKEEKEDDAPLPGNWEVMHDPTTGKPFYVDHERKITTWTRPKVETTTTSSFSEMSLRPAVATPPTSGNAAALSRSRRATTPAAEPASSSSWGRSYQQEMEYYSQPHVAVGDSDFSDALPPLDFTVKKVADALRPACAKSGQVFTMRLRRHHCRLCGDVFSDACSSHRVTLPLEGPEFEKPVRVCDFCHVDVEAGNFFSMRRYLTPLHLYEGQDDNNDDEEGGGGVATAQNVNCALSGLTQDLEQMIQTGTVNETKSIPPDVLVPNILKHLARHETADRTVRCMAALLAVEALESRHVDYARQMYENQAALDHLLAVLERSGNDRKTLYVQEQAARTVFYLTERKTVTSVVQKDGDERVHHLDIYRALQSMLDHCSNRKNPHLSRWAAACLQNLLAEDERRACLAVNDVAALVAVGEPATELSYESFLPQLTETGGVMILCSLLSADDADARAHAVAALGTALSSTRATDASMATLAELTGGRFGRTEPRDGTVIRAIVAGGGCDASVASLLLSADHSVAGMGCQFLGSLVRPLLQDEVAAVPSFYDYRHDTTGTGACREAAIEIAVGSCLPALLSLMRDARRPVELQQRAAETLAAVVYATGEMGKAWAGGQYEEGLEKSDAPSQFKQALMTLNQEGVLDAALAVLQSQQSLGSTTQETPSSRIREAAGLMLASLTHCSAEAIMSLQTTPQILSLLLTSSNDASFMVPSTLRADAAPRCLGVLETASSLFLFAWQHSSGAGSELLDRLMEVLDAGVVPYLSRVLNAKVEWDSSTKAVGGCKSKAAACRFLCCLFGIAQQTSLQQQPLGLRRLMDAVDADARGYRKGDKLPQNVMEAALSVLQTSSSKARHALLGGATEPHYQAAVFDLLDAALLAAGSLCGSAAAPGASKGTLIQQQAVNSSSNNKPEAVRPPDVYAERRQYLCGLATDIVIRSGGRGQQQQALLPTMLVGGLGEAAAGSSVRLALSICQNAGGPEPHAKLAACGILVPISDSLRTALSAGDLYKFSAALALVRYCGPHVAGGVDSVRHAIRVATNVLVLPINPEATVDQIETQESLKAECIRALEALSQNASLWSSISSEALPSIVRFLQMSSGGGTTDPRRQQTRCAALRAVLQIVQVPSHAVAAAHDGLAHALGQLLLEGKVTQGDEVPMLALEVLHVMAMNAEARRAAQFLEAGLVRSIAAAIAKSATLQPNKPSDSRADVTFLGLEILSGVLLDMTPADTPMEQVLASPAALAFLDAVATEPPFVRALCATLLLKTNMKVPRHDNKETTFQQDSFDVPKLYGDPLILVQEACGGHDDTHHAAAAILYTTCVFACAIESQRSEAFWKTVLVQDLQEADGDACLQLSATLAAHFLALLTVDYKPLVPQNDAFRQQEYATITRPLVRYRLLEWLHKECLGGGSGDEDDDDEDEEDDPYMISVLVSFNVPHICLSLWKDPALLDLAFDLIQTLVRRQADQVLHLFVEGQAALTSLFDLLNLNDQQALSSSKNVGEIRRFLGSTLGQLAESGLLTQAVERFQVRSAAIAALAAACLAEEERGGGNAAAEQDDSEEEEEVDTTSNRLSSVLMKCLVELCTVTDALGRKRISLTATEAESIAQSLGSKICQMVLSRFLERAKLQQYEMDDDDDDDDHDEDALLDAPDLAMLCAIAQHDAALQIVRSLGGLYALSLVAAEGHVAAVAALKKACQTDASVLLEGDAHQVVLGLFGKKDNNKKKDLTQSEQSKQVEGTAFELLARLCNDSTQGRNAVAESEHCGPCVERAMQVLCALAGFEVSSQDTKTDDDDDEAEDDAEDNIFEDDDEDEEEVAPPPPSAPSALPPPPPPSYEDMIGKAAAPPPEDEEVLAPVGESELGVSACLLLSALAPMPSARNVLVENEVFCKALSSLAGDTAVAELRYAGLQLVSALLPYVAGEDTGDDEHSNTDRLSQVLLSALTSEHKLKATPTLNANLLQSTALAGLMVVFDCLSVEQQQVAAQAVATQCRKTIKLCCTARSTAKQAQRLHAAQLSHHLTLALLMVRGKDFGNAIFTQALLQSLLNLIQWRLDPKTTSSASEKDGPLWNAAVSNTLLLLSLVLWRPDDILKRAEIDLTALAATTLMVARPGKAPRKAMDVQAALTKIKTSGTDASAALSAQRVLDRLY